MDQHTIGQIRRGSRRTRFAGTFLVLLLAAVMAGCGRDDTATGGGGATATTSAASPASLMPKQGGPPIWITVQSGQVAKIAEQFVP